MNEKIRGIARTAWNEPRHFFFWLTMFSLLGFIVIALGLAAGLADLLTKPGARPVVTLFAFVALGCILGMLVGIPAFIFAWIPPIRRLLAWLLGWRWLALGSLVTLVALFYAVEDWRGRHAWLSYKRDREAKGGHFDWASLAPPPVPKEQNFFETPLWDDLHFTETNGTTTWSDTNGQHRVVFSTYGPTGYRAPNAGGWLKAERVSLAAWQGYYRGHSNEVAKIEEEKRLQGVRNRYGLPRELGQNQVPAAPPTNYFPLAKEPQSPAADVLLALSRFETNRQLLIAAAARPQARFWINYDAGFGMLLPHLARLKSCSQYLALHADAALRAGDRATALEDIRTTFRIMEALRGEPILISQLVSMAVLHLGLQPVWEGLADQQWTEADLRVIELELGKLDFLADYQLAMRGERVCSIWGVDYARRRGLNALGDIGAQGGSSRPAEWERAVGRMLYQLVPAGWFDQNKLSVCRNNDHYMASAVDKERRIVPPSVVQRLQEGLGEIRTSPYDMLSRMLMPALAGSAEKFARAETTVDLARLACALERYRLANGRFPETLDALAPKFIAKLPHDVINGQPLKYRRTDDGQFVLYSVGFMNSVVLG